MAERLKAFATFCLAVRLMCLLNLTENSEVNGQVADNTGFSLLEEPEEPTPASCDVLKKRSTVKQSSNDSSRETNEMSQKRIDDCTVYPFTCPKNIKISWLHAAPFVFNTSGDIFKKNKENTLIIKGIFVDIARRAIGHCCQKYSGIRPAIRYLTRASNIGALQLELLNDSADIIMPVHSDEVSYGESFSFMKFIDSPGVVLILRYSPVYRWKLVLKAVRETWPVVLTSLLMSLVAGVVIWFLDKSHNPEEFSPEFHRGVFQGFWWAFVTMTTIGYGDKTPRSNLARSFAVLWMTIGITFCSVMTASLSSALTNVQVEGGDFAIGKRIGMLKGSVAFQEAVDLGADIKTFENEDDMYNALLYGNGIDGILEEFFTGIKSMEIKDTFRKLTIAKVIWNKRALGVVYRNSLFRPYISQCTQAVIKLFQNDVLNVATNYLQSTETTEGRILTDSEPFTINIFNSRGSESKAFMACVIAFSTFVFVCLVGSGISYYRKRHTKHQQDTDKKTTYTRTQGLYKCHDSDKSSTVGCHGQQQTEV